MGRDCGIINLANVLPQVAAQALGIVIFQSGAAQSFSLTHVAADLFALAGGALIARVRSMR